MGFLWKPRYALYGISNYYWQYRWRPLPQCPSSTSRAYEKPYCISCRNDGWHPEAKQCSWGCPNSPFSMVPTLQTWPHNKQSEVTQGQAKPTWQKASLQNELFWHIHPHCDMVWHQAYNHLWNHFLLGPLTSGLRYGLSTSSNQDGHLYGAATKDSKQAWELQRTHFEAREEYLRPKNRLGACGIHSLWTNSCP